MFPVREFGMPMLVWILFLIQVTLSLSLSLDRVASSMQILIKNSGCMDTFHIITIIQLIRISKLPHFILTWPCNHTFQRNFPLNLDYRRLIESWAENAQ